MGGGILSATTPAATEAKLFSEVYLATGSREDGAQNLKLQFAIPYHGVSSLSHVQERRAWKVGGDVIVIDQLMMNSE